MREQVMHMNPAQFKAYAKIKATRLFECPFKDNWDVVQEKHDHTNRWDKRWLTHITYNGKEFTAFHTFTVREPHTEMIADFETLLFDLKRLGKTELADFLATRDYEGDTYSTTDDMTVEVEKHKEVTVKDPVFYKWEVDKEVYENLTKGL